jgi:hypothetical protein
MLKKADREADFFFMEYPFCSQRQSILQTLHAGILLLREAAETRQR